MIIFNQTVPSDTWLISHNATTVPTVSVTVLHEGNYVLALPASVEVVDDTTIKVTFTVPRIGVAVLRAGGL